MHKSVSGSLVLVALLVSCRPETPLVNLVPANAVAVVYVDKPLDLLADSNALTKALGQTLPALPAEFPVDAIDPAQPWAGAVLPVAGAEDSGVPTFQFYLPLASSPRSFARIADFASKEGGLVVAQVGNYAVVSSTGAPTAQQYAPGKAFDLARVRLNEPRGIAVYVDVKNVMDSVVFPEALGGKLGALPLLQKELDGLRLGLYPTTVSAQPGVRLTLQADLKPTSGWKPTLLLLAASTRLEDWTPWLDEAALVGLGVQVPAASLADDAVWATIPDDLLRQHLKNLRQLLGPRLVFNLTGGLEPASTGPEFSGVLEARDPQAVRQALKSLVASGALQRNFLQFAMDADTPLVYQDSPGGPLGVRTRVTLGPFQVNLAWGTDKVYFASGTQVQALDTLVLAGRSAHPGTTGVPANASLLANASPSAWSRVLGTDPSLKPLLAPLDAAPAVHASLGVEAGTPRFQVWWGAEGLKTVWAMALQGLPGLLTGVADLPPPAVLPTRP